LTFFLVVDSDAAVILSTKPEKQKEGKLTDIGLMVKISIKLSPIFFRQTYQERIRDYKEVKKYSGMNSVKGPIL